MGNSKTARTQNFGHSLIEGVEDSTVLEAIASTPRHIFIDDVLQHKAYQNTALPIGQG
ncbi:MAG: protein-L-isoaspartate O-methyltransferase, partial [Pseudomonadota bacterium]